MELELNFANFLATHLCPPYSKVVSLLNQTVAQWPKGAAMLTGYKGIYTIKLWDEEKVKHLLGQKVEFFYGGESSSRSVKVPITKKPIRKRYTNPKYVTITGFDRVAEEITNSEVDKVLQQFGTIIVPTQEVFAENFRTGKKKLRIDLDQGKDIPRDFHLQYKTELGRTLNASLRLFYKDQPYFCRRCSEQHVGDCPQFIADKAEKENIRNMKEEKNKTVMVGDSNFRCINENGVMASVTAVTGGKIGHIVNQVSFENISKIENIILSAGQNCINDADELDQKFWEARTVAEIAVTETSLNKLLAKGKNVFMLSVPPAPCTQTSDRKRKAREFINKQIGELITRANTTNKQSGKTGIAGLVEEPDNSYDQTRDFIDERHLTQQAMERRISQIDDILPSENKLRNSILKARATCHPYRACYGAYPAGCNFCTKLNHGEQNCPTKIKHSGKRLTVSGSEEQVTKRGKTTE